jgi:hypothetical protein
LSLRHLIKQSERARHACFREMRDAYKFLIKNMKRIVQFSGLNVHGKVISKFLSGKYDMEM